MIEKEFPDAFSLGDYVKLRTGSMTMMVIDIRRTIGQPDQITCVWCQPKIEAFGMCQFPDFALKHAETLQ